MNTKRQKKNFYLSSFSTKLLVKKNLIGPTLEEKENVSFLKGLTHRIRPKSQKISIDKTKESFTKNFPAFNRFKIPLTKSHFSQYHFTLINFCSKNINIKGLLFNEQIQKLK